MINGKKVLAVILARAGSKGIPMKNVRDLLGKPLFIWSVEAALQSKYIDQIVLSSNCEECFKAYDKWYKDDSPFVLDSGRYDTLDSSNMRLRWVQRPDEISGPLSKNEEGLIHAYQDELKFQFEADIVVNLQVTSPCRLEGLVDACIEEYEAGGYDSLLTATKDTPFLWQKIDGKWEYTVDKNHCCDRKMRQEFEEQEFTYHDNGNLYITESRILLDNKCRIGYNPCVFETSGLNSLQIDEEFDFELIETMAKVRKLESLI
jgi:CMP-N-acetylneuraminic acid synthetase